MANRTVPVGASVLGRLRRLTCLGMERVFLVCVTMQRSKRKVQCLISEFALNLEWKSLSLTGLEHSTI